MSNRTCQGYMRLAKSNIDKRYWHLGMDKLHSLLEDKHDLSIFNDELLKVPRRRSIIKREGIVDSFMSAYKEERRL